MDITPLISKDKKIINRYSNQYFIVSQVKYSKNIILFPDKVINTDLKKASDVNFNSFIAEIDDHFLPEILLVGSGDAHYTLPQNIINQFESANILAESMTTQAAIRTYNTLIAEDRNIATILLLEILK